MKRAIPIFIAFPLLLLISTCGSLGSFVDLGSLDLSEDNMKALGDAATAVSKSFEDITPEQEYYIGRAVGANIVSTHKAFSNQKANSYVNLIGQSLAVFSDRPETFGGYHFLILDSNEINAFASPGGLVFITRGLLRLADTEDMVAAIIAHEIGHVIKKHGLQSIQQARVTDAIGKLALTGAKIAGSQEVAELTAIFEDSIGDITKTLIVNGYSQGFEFEADKESARILKRTGYDPYALIRVLQIMEKELEPGGLDFAKTHPEPGDRIRNVQGEVGKNKADTAIVAERVKRFQEFKSLI